MSTTASVPVTGPIPGDLKKKNRVLLVDTSRTKRELRAEVMRKLGVEVDCAADIPEARCWWKADLYDLVLINVEKEGEIVTDFAKTFAESHPRKKWRSWLGNRGTSPIHRTKAKIPSLRRPMNNLRL
jgi:hypothetical protein